MLELSNETNIKVCNVVASLRAHALGCSLCARYLNSGNESLCEHGKEIIARELAYADMSPVLSNVQPECNRVES